MYLYVCVRTYVPCLYVLHYTAYILTFALTLQIVTYTLVIFFSTLLVVLIIVTLYLILYLILYLTLYLAFSVYVHTSHPLQYIRSVLRPNLAGSGKLLQEQQAQASQEQTDPVHIVIDYNRLCDDIYACDWL